MVVIKVPASSANVGPGFDSAGIAVGRYLTLEVTEANEWHFIHKTDLIPDVLHYENHYIYKVAQHVAQAKAVDLTPATIVMDSDIPLARGLGSSASAIIAGIELANQLGNLALTQTEKLEFAVEIEGHPDNVAPCLLGGFIVSTVINGETFYKKMPSFNTDAIIYIPDFEVKTDDARKVLPTELPMAEAAQASSIGNVMLSALLTEDYELAGLMMENDLFHEPYRSKLIPHYQHVQALAKENGALGTIISGAGPTMISFVPKGKSKAIIDSVSKAYPNFEVTNVTLDNAGLIVK